MIPERLKKNYFKAMSIKSFKGLDFSGSSPKSVFVSESNYPNLKVGIVSLPEVTEDALIYDFPEQWLNFTSEEVLHLRKQLINSMTSLTATQAVDPSNKLMELQEIVTAKKQADVDINLKDLSFFKDSSKRINTPLMNYALMNSFDFISNPGIDLKVDKVISDTDLKSVSGIESLYSSGQEVSSIYKILSLGLLGLEKNRKLVPTKWSITATDDTISKLLIEKIKDNPLVGEHLFFESHYFDNHFYILLIPKIFSFEMLESWNLNAKTNAVVAVDFETFKGRTNYASNITGAYYSARLGAAEYLSSIKRQASVIIIREIGSSYTTPLGVWQIRENVRNAMKQEPKKFDSLSALLSHLKQKLKLPFNYYEKKSSLFGDFLHQKTLKDWF